MATLLIINIELESDDNTVIYSARTQKTTTSKDDEIEVCNEIDRMVQFMLGYITDHPLEDTDAGSN